MKYVVCMRIRVYTQLNVMCACMGVCVYVHTHSFVCVDYILRILYIHTCVCTKNKEIMLLLDLMYVKYVCTRCTGITCSCLCVHTRMCTHKTAAPVYLNPEPYGFEKRVMHPHIHGFVCA